jgi:hypothetical protein
VHGASAMFIIRCCVRVDARRHGDTLETPKTIQALHGGYTDDARDLDEIRKSLIGKDDRIVFRMAERVGFFPRKLSSSVVICRLHSALNQQLAAFEDFACPGPGFRIAQIGVDEVAVVAFFHPNCGLLAHASVVVPQNPCGQDLGQM